MNVHHALGDPVAQKGSEARGVLEHLRLRLLERRGIGKVIHDRGVLPGGVLHPVSDLVREALHAERAPSCEPEVEYKVIATLGWGREGVRGVAGRREHGRARVEAGAAVEDGLVRDGELEGCDVDQASSATAIGSGGEIVLDHAIGGRVEVESDIVERAGCEPRGVFAVSKERLKAWGLSAEREGDTDEETHAETGEEDAVGIVGDIWDRAMEAGGEGVGVGVEGWHVGLHRMSGGRGLRQRLLSVHSCM